MLIQRLRLGNRIATAGASVEGVPVMKQAVWLAIAVICLAGCSKPAPKSEAAPTPTVTVSRPIAKEITYYVDFTGRTSAPAAVDVRPRVTGYLVQMPFEEGAEVKVNDLLFEIDPRPYQAQLDLAQGQVILSEARLSLAKAENARAQTIAKGNTGAISKQELEKYAASEAEADAAVEVAKANLESFKINLEFTKILAPIAGRVNRYNYTVGNLVNADNTTLTSIVSQDPMYVYFDVDEQTMLRVIRQNLATKLNREELKKERPVMMAVGDETGFPHEGHLDFIDSSVSSSTGTLSVRATFANPASESGQRLLRPGMFVKVRVPLGKPRPSLLVSERALATDQGRKYVLVVDEQNTVKQVSVTVGPLQDDGLRVIESGLTEGDRVIVSGLQLVRPKAKVKLEEVPMTGSRQDRQGSASSDSSPAEPASK